MVVLLVGSHCFCISEFVMPCFIPAPGAFARSWLSAACRQNYVVVGTSMLAMTRALGARSACLPLRYTDSASGSPLHTSMASVCGWCGLAGDPSFKEGDTPVVESVREASQSLRALVSSPP